MKTYRPVRILLVLCACSALMIPSDLFAQGPPPLPSPSTPPPLPPVPSVEWYAGIAGKQAGPFTTAELTGKIVAGEVTADTLLWKEGMEGWEKAGSLEDIKGRFSTLAPPLPLDDGPGIRPAARLRVRRRAGRDRPAERRDPALGDSDAVDEAEGQGGERERADGAGSCTPTRSSRRHRARQ